MYASAAVTGLVSLFAIGASALPSRLSTRQALDNNIGLSVTAADFDINELQTFRVSYANTSAYIGQIKYQSYSEPLIVGDLNTDDNSVTFLSIHASPTGYQQMYVVPHESQPVGFSVPHGSAPSGARTDGFTIDMNGNLLNNGLNLFFACQDGALAAMNSYQIYWLAGGDPEGMSCKGPITIQNSDACARM